MQVQMPLKRTQVSSNSTPSRTSVRTPTPPVPHDWLYSHAAALGQPVTLLATQHLAGLTSEVALQSRGDQLFPPEHRVRHQWLCTSWSLDSYLLSSPRQASLASLLSLACSLQHSGLIDSTLLLSTLTKVELTLLK